MKLWRSIILAPMMVLILVASVLARDDGIVERSKENSAQAQEALVESDKGVDDDGDKIWKQGAREFFNFKKNPKNRTFEMPVEWAKKFIDEAYNAGAEQVWVTSISEFEIGEHKLNISDTLVVVLPPDPAKRKAVLEVHNNAVGDDDEMTLKDIGQKYIYIEAD
jgi:hypothetical protein